MSGVCRDLEALEPDTRARVKRALAYLDGRGIKYFVSETRRSQEVQDAYYAQGRQPMAEVNRLRALAGLWPLTASEAAKVVTQARVSRHLVGVAIDLVPAKDGQPWWSAPAEEWTRIAEVMKREGMTWGGDWRDFKDSPHYQNDLVRA